MTETRKLAAILAADVVGFSRLTGVDDDRTLARLRALRSDLIDPTIAVHNGRVIKRTVCGLSTPARLAHAAQVSPLPSSRRPNIPPPTALWARASFSQSPQRARRVS